MFTAEFIELNENRYHNVLQRHAAPGRPKLLQREESSFSVEESIEMAAFSIENSAKTAAVSEDNVDP